MPRLFFDIDEDGQVRRDSDGTDLRDISEARAEAVQMLVRLAADELPSNGRQKTITVVVRNADDRRLFKATLSYEEQSGELG